MNKKIKRYPKRWRLIFYMLKPIFPYRLSNIRFITV